MKRPDFHISAAMPMTELQLRLWCLWMCEEFADLDDWMDDVEAAAQRSSMAMLDMLAAIYIDVGALTAWKLSERMP